MKYSIIIPAFQCADTIEETVKSVRKSGLDNYEIVIVDDGSTDKTAIKCRALAKEYQEIKYFFQENKGVSSARNFGMKMALGEYVLFLDADDSLAPFNMSVIEQNVEKHVDVIIYGMEFSYYKKDALIRKECLTCGKRIELNKKNIGEYFSELFCCNYFSSACNKFIRKSIIEEAKISFDENLTNYEDLKFSLQLLKSSELIVAIPDINYLYKLEYGIDRMISRISTIEDIMENTDIIAEAFWELDNKILKETEQHISNIYNIIMQIYIMVFWCKMKTTSLFDIKCYCHMFMKDIYIQKLLKEPLQLDSFSIRLIEWITKEKSYKIWFKSRYSMIRHEIANFVKVILKG